MTTWNAELVDQLEWRWQHQLRPTAGLARPQGAISPPEYADAPMAKLILYTNLEVIHHGAEISLLRDLCLRKDSRDGI